jgi:hypothetical protein
MCNKKSTTVEWLSKPNLTYWLTLVNILVGCLALFLFKNQTGGDTYTYIGLADGILNGEYSYWYFTNDYFPDTFRNPGYPLFLLPIRYFTESIFVIQLIQLAMYFASIFLVLQIIDILFNSIEIKNLFLLFLIPSIHVASYTAMVFPEILVTFLMVLFFRIDVETSWDTWLKYFLIGILFGIIFQIRPIILFVPFIYIFIRKIIYRSGFSWLKHLFMTTVFLITMIPYGLWNLRNHGVFKVTSLEGGGGVFHLGYWALKLPDYYEGRYWNNYCSDEMVPMINELDRQANVDLYNREWDKIDSMINPLKTFKDTLMESLHKENPALIKTYSSSYVIGREEILRQMTIQNIMNDFSWYVKVKTYSAIRLWVTGIPKKEVMNARYAKKLTLIYPFVITLFTFLSAIIMLPVLFYKTPEIRKTMTVMLVITIYFGLIHIPFTIQSRYTIPVRLELLLLLAVAVYHLFFTKKYPTSSR